MPMLERALNKLFFYANLYRLRCLQVLRIVKHVRHQVKVRANTSYIIVQFATLSKIRVRNGFSIGSV